LFFNQYPNLSINIKYNRFIRSDNTIYFVTETAELPKIITRTWEIDINSEQALNNFLIENKIAHSDPKYQELKNNQPAKLDDLVTKIKYQSLFDARNDHSWKLEYSIIINYQFEAKKMFPNYNNYSSEGWSWHNINPRNYTIINRINNNVLVFNNEKFYFAGEDWAQKNIIKFKLLITPDATKNFYDFQFLQKTDWLGYKYIIPVSFANKDNKYEISVL
jgi:hypothetical protein